MVVFFSSKLELYVKNGDSRSEAKLSSEENLAIHHYRIQDRVLKKNAVDKS
jgi:hypothetical protein